MFKRLSYAKYLFEHGKNTLANKSSLYNALAILIFHDAAELFLTVIADKLTFKTQDHFMDYWKEVEDKGHSLPYKNELKKLNKIRVDFKHYGILPLFDECIECETTLNHFFSEVARDILELDFSTVSVSDLIENPDIRKHVRAAEKYKDEGNFGESIIESTIAFNYVGKVARGDSSHSFFIEKNYWDLKKVVPTLRSSGYTSTNRALQNNFRDIETSFKEVQHTLEEIIQNVNVLLLGVDIFKYKRFNSLTPRTYTDGKGVVHISEGATSIFCNEVNFNQKNALFCIHFVIDTAMKIEQNPLDLININAPKVVRINNERAILYEFIDNELKEIGLVSEEKEFRVIESTYIQSQRTGMFYEILNQGNKVLISADDVEILK